MLFKDKHALFRADFRAGDRALILSSQVTFYQGERRILLHWAPLGLCIKGFGWWADLGCGHTCCHWVAKGYVLRLRNLGKIFFVDEFSHRFVLLKEWTALTALRVLSSWVVLAIWRMLPVLIDQTIVVFGGAPWRSSKDWSLHGPLWVVSPDCRLQFGLRQTEI